MRSFNTAESNARASSSAKRSTLHSPGRSASAEPGAPRFSSGAPCSPLPAPSKVERLAACASSDAPRFPLYAPRSSPGAPRSPLNAPRSSAFTLIELLVVMVVMVIILTVSLPAFINIGRGMSMRAAVNSVRSTVALSRQWAITHREEIMFVGSATGLTYNTATGVISPATNDHACYYVTNAMGNVIQAITDLPLDITFDASGWASSQTNLIFKTDGGLDAFGNEKKIVLVDKRNPTDTDKQRTITIKVLTGGIRVE